MDFSTNTAQDELLATVRLICQEHCSQQQLQSFEASNSFPQKLFEAMGAAGLLKHALPTAMGGSGALDAALICETLGYYSGLALSVFVVNSACAVMLAAGKSDDAEQLRGLLTAKQSMAFALTEPEAGSDATGIQTRAERIDAGWQINGTKWYCTGAAQASHVLVVARTDIQQKASRGSGLFLVPTDCEGITIKPMPKLASNGHASCEMRLNNVLVDGNAAIGDPNRAWPIVILGGGYERLMVAAGAVGSMNRVLDECSQHAGQRHQFGQPILEFQGVSHKLADLATDLDAARWLTYRAAWLIDQGNRAGAEISKAKLFASERSVAAALTGMRVFGGRAYLQNSPIQRILRESLLTLYAGGTSEIQRNLIVREMG